MCSFEGASVGTDVGFFEGLLIGTVPGVGGGDDDGVGSSTTRHCLYPGLMLVHANPLQQPSGSLVHSFHQGLQLFCAPQIQLKSCPHARHLFFVVQHQETYNTKLLEQQPSESQLKGLGVGFWVGMGSGVGGSGTYVLPISPTAAFLNTTSPSG